MTIQAKRVLTPKVILLTLVIAGVLLCAAIIYIIQVRPSAGINSTPVSGMTLLPPPTSTPTYSPPTLTPVPPTPTASFTPAPGQIALGVYVQIVGTGGEGLNLRAQPGLKSPSLFLGYDSEVFQITKGPQQADGYTWWYLTAPYDQARSGWAAQSFLSILQSP